jgi:hypothetical protein
MPWVSNVLWVCLCSNSNAKNDLRCSNCGTKATDCNAPSFDLDIRAEKDAYNTLLHERMTKRRSETPRGPLPVDERRVHAGDDCQCVLCRPDLYDRANYLFRRSESLGDSPSRRSPPFPFVIVEIGGDGVRELTADEFRVCVDSLFEERPDGSVVRRR